MFTPSIQQSHFFNWVSNGKGSAVLTAVAGAGKTTTLIEGLKLMSGTKFFGAYNKKIAEEISARAGIQPGLDVGTMHAAGFKFLRRAFPKVRVDGKKCNFIFADAVTRTPTYAPFAGSVLKLVSLAKQSGIGILQALEDRSSWLELIEHYDIEVFDEEQQQDNTNLVIALAKKTLKSSIELDHTVCDFDDMIFSPLYHKVKVFEYDWVLIDEAQDTNATRRALALRMLKRGGRMIAVGDRHQAIYGFTGADSDSLDLIAKAVNAIELPLTITYRCPKSVVRYAQQWVSHIQAADTAPEGSVITEVIENLEKLAKPGDAILCRFNAPLIEYVYRFISAGIPAKVEGREIGTGLKVLANRWKVRSFAALLEKLEKFSERETAKYRAKEEESKAVAVEDKVHCLQVLIGRAQLADPQCRDPVGAVNLEIDNIFVENGTGQVVLFSSIHKSKGREWDTVIWLQTGPSGWARKEWELQQEDNLCYVASTRAKQNLILIQIPAK